MIDGLLVPLVGGSALVTLALVPIGLAAASTRTRLSRLGTAIALALFSDRVARSDRRERYRARLRAARVGSTYRAYAARTLLYTAFAALSSVVLGAGIVAVVLTTPPYLEALAELFPTTGGYIVLDAAGWLAIALIAGVLVGGVAGLATYSIRCGCRTLGHGPANGASNSLSRGRSRCCTRSRAAGSRCPRCSGRSGVTGRCTARRPTN
jgi:hypothetical protein